MFPLAFGFLFLSLGQSSAHSPENGSVLLPRTFSGHLVLVTEEPVDYIDLSVLDSLHDDDDDDDGSGFETEQKPMTKHSHRHHLKKHYVVSEEAKEFLQGLLATTFIPTIYTLVFIISVPLNLLALVMFVRRIRPRKPAVIYMLNLACADLLFGLLLPFKIAYHYHGNNWIYGSFMCRVVTAAFHCNMYCSVLLVMCISMDRFLAVVYPMNSLTWRSPKTAAAICAAMWLLSLGGVSPLLISGQTLHLPDLGITTCHDVQDVETLQSYYLYFFPIYSSIFFFIPLFFTIFCYVRIIKALAVANVENCSKKTRAIVMIVVVLLVFVICFSPTNIILMVHYVQISHTSSDGSYQAYLLSMCIGSLSCCLDPLLYYYGSSQCQKQVVAVFRCTRLRSSGSTLDTGRTYTSGSSYRSRKMESMHTGLGGQYNKLVV
ncbi:proteinase-activated receptor 1 isoform X1 [Girardinichthys multiradiatus]|uniref:proteinase-activated receptor 1 isoform X1 n=1 Tax=Girardinichthys multiradiatus TaxID=208333 RepID=UPI001FAC72B1|nr:proteinase-activated receptor 1 isoform X1 [Girardinichthys multiradiatus]